MFKQKKNNIKWNLNKSMIWLPIYVMDGSGGIVCEKINNSIQNVSVNMKRMFSHLNELKISLRIVQNRKIWWIPLYKTLIYYTCTNELLYNIIIKHFVEWINELVNSLGTIMSNKDKISTLIFMNFIYIIILHFEHFSQELPV